MPQLLYLNKTECAVLATALNTMKPSSYPENQRGLVPKIGRRIANFLVDGQTSEDSKAAPKKKLIGFAKARAEDEELKQMCADMNVSVPPRPTVIVDDMPSLPVLPEREAAYAVLRGESKLANEVTP